MNYNYIIAVVIICIIFYHYYTHDDHYKYNTYYIIGIIIAVILLLTNKDFLNFIVNKHQNKSQYYTDLLDPNKSTIDALTEYHKRNLENKKELII